MAKRAEYEHTGFGRWKWVDKTYCDRCGREIQFPWENHTGALTADDGLMYSDLDSACYDAVKNGQPAMRHFIGALDMIGRLMADDRNNLQGTV